MNEGEGTMRKEGDERDTLALTPAQTDPLTCRRSTSRLLTLDFLLSILFFPLISPSQQNLECVVHRFVC